MIETQVYRHFNNGLFMGMAWFSIGRNDRITGKWRIIDDDIQVEIGHTRREGWFSNKIIERLRWYGSDEVRFIQEFCCDNA